MNKKRKLSESNETVENDEDSYDIMDTNEATEQESSSTVNFKIHFKVSGLKDKIGVCLLCEKKNIEKIIKMKSANTTGLKRHLERYHRDIYNSIFSKNKAAPDQKKLTDMLTKVSPIMFYM